MTLLQDRRDRNRVWVRGYLDDHPCVDCGEDDPRVLQFDHRDPSEKKGSVSSMVTNGVSLDIVQQEVAKCDVRCCNCHRKKDMRVFIM